MILAIGVYILFSREFFHLKPWAIATLSFFLFLYLHWGNQFTRSLVRAEFFSAELVITPNIKALLRHPELNIHEPFFSLLEKDAQKFVYLAKNSLWLKGDLRFFIRPGWVWNEHLKVINDSNFENAIAFSDQTAGGVLHEDEIYLNMRYKEGKLLFYFAGKEPWLAYNAKQHFLLLEFPVDDLLDWGTFPIAQVEKDQICQKNNIKHLKMETHPAPLTGGMDQANSEKQINKFTDQFETKYFSISYRDWKMAT